MTTSFNMNQDFTADYTASLVEQLESKVAKAKTFRPATFDVRGYLEYLFDYAGDKAAAAARKGEVEVAQYNQDLQKVIEDYIVGL